VLYGGALAAESAPLACVLISGLSGAIAQKFLEIQRLSFPSTRASGLRVLDWAHFCVRFARKNG
jgi:hypothetical protein